MLADVREAPGAMAVSSVSATLKPLAWKGWAVAVPCRLTDFLTDRAVRVCQPGPAASAAWLPLIIFAIRAIPDYDYALWWRWR